MNLLASQKFKYLDIIKYGIYSIGKEAKISDIKEVFRGEAKVVDDSDDMDVYSTNHAYLGQEHLRLDFKYNDFYGFIDFDLMPNDHFLKSEEQAKRLVNFKTQIFANNDLAKLPLINAAVYLDLKKEYGVPNNFDQFERKKKKEFIKMDKLLRQQYKLFGANSDEIQIWYIEKQEIYYLVSFYYFKGGINVPPYLSFAITEMFKFL